MDYSKEIIDEMNRYKTMYPDYSFGEIIYSTLTILMEGEVSIDKSCFLKMEDHDFLGALGASMKKERSESYGKKDQ